MEEIGESEWGGYVQQPGDFIPKASALPATGSSQEAGGDAKKRKRAVPREPHEPACSSFAEAGGLSISEPQATKDMGLLKSLMMDDAQTAEITDKFTRWPGLSTETNPGTSSSNRSGLNIQCKECLSDEGPGRMGPLCTHYAGLFYCKRCWDWVEAADPTHKLIPKGGSGMRPAAQYNYEVVIGELYEGRGHKKVRLLERNEAGLWKIQYINHTKEDNMPESALVAVANTKDRVESVEELKTMLRTLFADIPKGKPRHLSCRGLTENIRKRFSREIDPKLFGHKQLITLMRDARLSGEFEEKDLFIREVQLTCSPIQGEPLE